MPGDAADLQMLKDAVSKWAIREDILSYMSARIQTITMFLRIFFTAAISGMVSGFFIAGAAPLLFASALLGGLCIFTPLIRVLSGLCIALSESARWKLWAVEKRRSRIIECVRQGDIEAAKIEFAQLVKICPDCIGAQDRQGPL